MDRAIRPTHKAHGASGPWKVDLRDAMSIPDPVALAKVRAMAKLQHPVWTLKEIDRELRRKFFTLILPHVPRLLPNPDTTLAHYDGLCKVYGSTSDPQVKSRIRCNRAFLLHSPFWSGMIGFSTST